MPFKSTVSIQKQIMAQVVVRADDPRRDLLAEIVDLASSPTFSVTDLTHVLGYLLALSEGVSERDVQVSVKMT